MKEEFSAGGVLIREGQILLIKNPSDVWTFPKGLVEEGEKPEDTAVREVYEETGVRGKIISELGKINYWYVREGEKIRKSVVYYLMAYVDGEPEPSWEVKDAKFFPAEEVERLLKYRGDREIFHRALKAIPSQGASS
ncbi:MAG: NUDIX hydrolase [Aquificaceae bacterium]|uniref:NUDIX hydrolase n=1 Tax=Hydrogenobacter sp. Uz 6-8 TaxID=3384828 RepID=UPI0030AD3C7A